MTRLAVIGTGKVGGEVAFLSAARNLADTLIIYDNVPALLRAQALDLLHTGLPIEVETGLKGMRDADICVFTAGTPRSPSVKTRADLLEANKAVAELCTRVLSKFQGILITVTNPMDINNFYLHKKTDLPADRCIGFGGQLDSARFALALKEHHMPCEGATVLGEHGEYQVPVFSRCNGAAHLDNRESILQKLRSASMEVISGKGGTVFGPAWHITSLIDAIVHDRRKVIPCSCILSGEYGIEGCSLGVPARIGKEGVLGIDEWKLDSWEQQKWENAGKFVQNLTNSLEFSPS